MVRVLNISDSHLGHGKPHFNGNWMPLRAWIKEQGADLVVHSGDLTVDGADREEDFRHCADMFAALDLPMLPVPGNHDVGEAGHPAQPVDQERLARWRRFFGPDYWFRDVENWRLIGLNAMLVSDGGSEERAQRDWLEDTMRTAETRAIAWFLHRPLFIDGPDEGDTGYWSVKPDRRADLLALAGRFGVRLIASGHVHKAHDFVFDGIRFLWCPASSFLVGPGHQPDMPGERRLGAAMLEFSGTDCMVTIRDVPGLETIWIDDVIQEVYPPDSAA